jgi:hypothetical protein
LFENEYGFSRRFAAVKTGLDWTRPAIGSVGWLGVELFWSGEAAFSGLFLRRFSGLRHLFGVGTQEGFPPLTGDVLLVADCREVGLWLGTAILWARQFPDPLKTLAAAPG